MDGLFFYVKWSCLCGNGNTPDNLTYFIWKEGDDVKYYVMSDTHGFYSETVKALKENGFFNDSEPHKLILCGDMMDRGQEAVELQNFMSELLSKRELIFVRGNHEDLMVNMINKIDLYMWDIALGMSNHNSNGTWDTALQLAGIKESFALRDIHKFADKVADSVFYKELIPASVDYYETEHHVFVHGWIPVRGNANFSYDPKWRNANRQKWNGARWLNGMDMSEKYKVVEPGKTIVCGHWHCSYGHCEYNRVGSEFGPTANFEPYYGNGVIAIDACTALSGKVNCIVIED